MLRSMHPHRAGSLALLGALSAFSLVLFGLPGGSEAQVVLADLGMVAIGLVAAGCALTAAGRQPTGRGRRSWLLIGLALLCWALGDAYWSWQELAVGEAPGVPSWADLGYLLLIPLGVAGIAIRPVGDRRAVNRVRMLLDAGIMLAALTAVTWTFVIGPLFEQSATDPLAQSVALAYPLGDLAIAFCSLVLLLRDGRGRLSTRLLAAGWAAAAAADSTYLVLVAADSYQTGHPIDLLWFAGLAVLALAGLTDRPALEVASKPRGISRPWGFVAPLLVVVLAGAVIWLAPLVATGAWPPLDQIALALATILVVARVAASYRDTVMIHELHLREAEEREAARAAREEAARLQGVVLTGRELGHLLSNDLGLVLGAIEVVKAEPALPAAARTMLDQAVVGLDRGTEHLRQLSRIQRVATKETPVGPALDLDRSAA